MWCYKDFGGFENFYVVTPFQFQCGAIKTFESSVKDLPNA